MSRRKRRAGFTLLELLATLGIIVVLFVLLLPTMRLMLDKARGSKMVNHMKALSASLNLYAAEHNGSHIPLIPPVGTSWRSYLLDYLPWTSPIAYNSVWHDQMDLTKYEAYNPYAPNVTLNYAIFDRKLSTISNPSKLLMITTGIKDPAYGINNADGSMGGLMYVNSNYYYTADRCAKMTRLEGIHYCVFADGHFATVPQSTMIEEANKDRGPRTSLFFDSSKNNGAGY